MPQLSTGLVIAGAYADKLRRVLFAQLRDKIKKKEITGQQVAQRAGQLNRLLFDIIVNRLKLDKGDAVRIRIEYEVKDGDIEWKLDTLRIEAFRRIPDEEVEKAIRETIKAAEEVLAKPVSAEEAAWTGEKAEKPREEKVEIKEYPPPQRIARLKPLGRMKNGALYILYGEDGTNLGILTIEMHDGKTKLDSIIVLEGKAYRLETILDKPYTEAIREVEEEPEKILEVLNQPKYREMRREEAERVLREKMQSIS